MITFVCCYIKAFHNLVIFAYVFTILLAMSANLFIGIVQVTNLNCESDPIALKD